MNVSTNYLLTSIRYALIVCYILISLVPAVAQMRLDQNKKLSQYVLRGWNTEDGLATEAINELIQTPDGYIWIATYSGLHRFDGKEFTVYNGKNSAIPSSNVATLQTDHENTLWIGGLHGIAKYVSGEFIVPKPLEETKNYSIEEMLITKSKEIWFSTKSNSLFRFNGNKLEDFTEEFEVANSTILTIREDLKGSIYFGTDDSQLIIYSDGKVDKHQLDIEVNGVNALYAYQDLVYLGTGRGLYIWDGKDLSKSSVLSNTTINEIIIDSNRNFWMGTLKGLFKFNEKSNTLDSLTEQNGMPNNIVRDHIFDQEGNLWVGTYRSGIFFLSDGSITSFTENDGLATDIITSTTEIEPGTFLLGNENGVLNLLRNDSITPYTPPIKIPSERLKNLVTDSKGRVWISTYGGLIILDGEKSKHHSVANGFPDNFIRVAYEDQQGTMWIGTKNAGLFAFTSKDDWKQITIHDGLSSNYIMSIEEDLKGNLLVSTMSGLNFVKDGKIIKSITVDDGLPSNFMFSTYPDNEFIWIASNDGLTGYSDDRIVNFTTENGLPSNSIYDVLPDKEGNFWIPSENSIIFIDKDDLSSALRDPDLKIKAKQFDKSYSMKNSHCLGAVHSFSDSEGQFWIPTLGGIVKLDPQEVQSPELKPKTIIENIYADNNPLDFDSKVIVPSGISRLQFDFTGISYTKTESLQFRYRLVPFDEKWVGASEDRNGFYTNLPPGEYEFQLQTGLDSDFTTSAASIKVLIEANWYQTLWAKILAIIIAILTILILYWVRTKSLKLNNLKLEGLVRERTHALETQKLELKSAIKQLKSAQEQMVQSDKMASLGILAAGVAHEINNPLNFIQGGVDGLEQALKNSDKIESDSYSALMGAIKEGISRASTIVSSLNEFSHSSEEKMEPCNIRHMIDNCLTMIRYRLKSGIEIEKSFPEDDPMVLGNNRKLHQAFLNILTNAIQAIERQGTIKILTSVSKKFLTLSFVDSGQGIKKENLKKITEPFFSTKDPGQGTGLGLSITYAIIHEHGGSLSYSSEWGKGTTATIKLPLIQKK